ncbi:MAG: IS1634 family transposase [Endomicrobium sp.]|nr:IS1634 family transposase [Endomicrobium sp.]
MNNGTTKVRIISKEGRKVVKVKHIGTAHNEEELKTLMFLAQDSLEDPRQGKFKIFEPGKYLQTKIMHKKSYSKLLFYTLGKVYDKLELSKILDKTFRELVITRIIEPTSKLDSIRVLKELGLKSPSNTTIHRCLKRIVTLSYSKKVAGIFIKYAKLNKAALLLYDVTTLYFEIEKEDEYRKRGLSKERRLEPQIIVGLLVNEKGFPLAISSFEGNQAETKTIIPVLKEFKRNCGIKNITVVSDAAMLSAENLDILEEDGFKFIVGSRLAKTPYAIKEYRKAKESEKLPDGQIFDTTKEFINKITRKIAIRRVIYQYKQQRAKLDLLNIHKQIKKAQMQLSDNSMIKKSRFLKIVRSHKEINQKLIKEAKLKAGIKGYVTNLDLDEEEIIKAYHNLFQVEKSFRMAKSDLKARPIFHQTRHSIEAHLTICFTALAISRYIQDRTNTSIKKFVQRLKPLRTVVISIGSKEYTAEPEIDQEIQRLLDLLN